jgi:hypothetical protein
MGMPSFAAANEVQLSDDEDVAKMGTRLSA